MLLIPALALASLPLDVHVYEVDIDAAMSRLHVHACFGDGLPDRLVADHRLAVEASNHFQLQINNARVTREAARATIYFPQPSDDSCVDWDADLERIAETQKMNIGYRTGGSLLLAPATWLWRPPILTANRNILFRFHLPQDMQLSVPWKPVHSDDGSLDFIRDHSPLDWPALMAVGRLETFEISPPGAKLRVAITDGPAHADPALARHWLTRAANAVSTLWGAFPAPDVQVLVIPVRKGYDAAPWAQTSRGGGSAAQFYMNAAGTAAMFEDDWIATHELSHFAMPFIRRSDAWLSEGFASYYQVVLRARAGAISEQQAWNELLDGFSRGNHNTENETLDDDTLYMQSRGRTMRVYWSGAAIALLADVELRRRSHGEWSLDRVLEAFDRCCRERVRSWTARDVFSKFDELSGTDVFDTLYVQNVYSRHFPRLTETLAALGVDATGSGVVLRPDAPANDIRAAIMQRNEKRQAQAGRVAE